MKTTTNIIRVGGTLYARIPIQMVEALKLNAEDIVDIEITKDKFSNIKAYRCKICEYHFCTDDETPYCSGCGEERIENLEEIHT